MRMYNIRRIYTSRYSPRANGEIERRWRTMTNLLQRNAINMSVNDLDHLVPNVCFTMNNVINKSTNVSPSYLMFTFNPSTPTLKSVYTRVNKRGVVQYAVERERERIKLISLIRKSLSKARLSRAKQFNTHAHKHFKEGDNVFIRVYRVKVPKKLAPKFTADHTGLPFIVIEIRGAYLYLYDQTDDSFFYEHGDNVRKFKGNTSPTPYPILGKGVFVPQNQKDLLFDSSKKGGDPLKFHIQKTTIYTTT